MEIKVCKECWNDIDPSEAQQGIFKLSNYLKLASHQKDYETTDVFCSDYCVNQWIAKELETCKREFKGE
jgi:hypothetical protein